MIDTTSKILVPEPISPAKSANIVKAPIHMSPNAITMGMCVCVYFDQLAKSLTKVAMKLEMTYLLLGCFMCLK